MHALPADWHLSLPPALDAWLPEPGIVRVTAAEPVELTARQARTLANALHALADAAETLQ